MTRRALALLSLLLLASACAPDEESPRVLKVDANPTRGFHFPYFLAMPEGEGELTPVLLVEPNNTGSVDDSLAVHEKDARRLASGASIGARLAEELRTPLLVPAFPRPETRWRIYTHALDRDSLLEPEGELQRLDLQLIAMIDDARERLAKRGLDVPPEVLLNGFSASGTFANRFTALHPERVRAVTAGGVNGIPLLPESRRGGRALIYPLGVFDFEALSGRSFQREAWLRVPQLIYMGSEDTNDAVAYDDGYSDEERALVHELIGEPMQPDRWEACRAAYAESGANAVLRTYEGVGHGTNAAIHRDLVEFLRAALAER